MSRRKVVYRLFFQCWLIFFSQNYQSRSKEYNSNWCWHRTLHLKKKKIPYLENVLKTSGTTRTVLRYSCLKILQTSMCVDCFASCENVVPRFQTSSILPFFLHPLDWSLNPFKETLLQPVLKSFITAFTIIRGYKINQQDLRFYAWLHL